MTKYIELLAPGGDADSIKAAIAAGADAVYCGLDKFNARNRASNIRFDDLPGIIRLAHQHNCTVFLTLNILILEPEIPAFIGVLNKLANTKIDGIIVQDLGMFYLLSTYFKNLPIHASTQLTTHNEGQIRFLHHLTATRVNLSRELSISEIKALTQVAHQNNVLTEIFVHGSLCLSFSGLCYMSSVHGGNSGNRGRCSQPCRDQYLITPAGKNFPLNLKDNSAFADLRELADAGIDSIKIEGRIKKFHYVYTVVDAWRQQLSSFYRENKLISDSRALYSVFNRDFTNAFLKGTISKDMFIDNPRDHSAIHAAEVNSYASGKNLEKAKGEVYEERTELIRKVEQKLKDLSIAKVPMTISLSGVCGTPLKVTVETPEKSFVVVSEINLADAGTQAIDEVTIRKWLSVLNDTEYFMEQLETKDLSKGLFLPFKELKALKKRFFYILSGSRVQIEPIAPPVMKSLTSKTINPSLFVLISSPEDVHLCNDTSSTICFQLPECVISDAELLVELFTKNPRLVPWFPPVLIGENFQASVNFLQRVKPKRIVANNTGIAYEAYVRGISWIAGPYLNLTNSFGLLCLKEKFNCSGAFISNELSRVQLKPIKNPGNFDLYYSIYHPIALMTSRQCLFQQVTGCEKDIMDAACLQQCNKTASITNLKNNSFVIEKSKGSHHRIYHDQHYMNTEIVSEMPNFFTGFLIDLSDIKTSTTTDPDKLHIIDLFKQLLNGNPDAKMELNPRLQSTTNVQYRKGI